MLQPEPGQVAFFPNVDAIQEFKIESNSPPAEFGRFNGGVVNLTTKSGTNAFHGTAFEFFRNEALNARNFFASTNPVKPKFRRNQFGGVLGGPIRQDSHLLLRRLPGAAADDRPHGDLHGADAACSDRASSPRRSADACRPSTIRRRRRRTERAGHAHAVPRQQRFRASGSIRSRATLLEHYPLPTSAGTANNYRRVADETVDQDQFNVRIDHQLRRQPRSGVRPADAISAKSSSR